MNKQELWQKVLDFHGHECGGLMIGFQAALYASELLKLTLSEHVEDEEVVCISENDACCVDAIQVLLGCTVGKGNLLFHMTGKMAFSFFNRETGQSVRLVLKPLPREMTREESLDFYRNKNPQELFSIGKPRLEVPAKARIFDSYVCECCGEKTGSNWIRLQGGKKLCVDCYESYDRFHI